MDPDTKRSLFRHIRFYCHNILDVRQAAYEMLFKHFGGNPPSVLFEDVRNCFTHVQEHFPRWEETSEAEKISHLPEYALGRLYEKAEFHYLESNFQTLSSSLVEKVATVFRIEKEPSPDEPDHPKLFDYVLAHLLKDAERIIDHIIELSQLMGLPDVEALEQAKTKLAEVLEPLTVPGDAREYALQHASSSYLHVLFLGYERRSTLHDALPLLKKLAALR